MGRVCIYKPDETDFSTNGLGILQPIECFVTEEENGMFELEIKHPIDETYRWAQIVNDYLIKAPCPTRESPLYEAFETITETTTVTRTIWEVVGTSVGVYMRAGPGTNYRNFGYLRNGQRVIQIDDEIYRNRWLHCCVEDGGRVCYISTKYLRNLGQQTETISTGGTVTGEKIIRFTQAQDQLFRIYEVDQDTDRGTVTAKAMHVFYDARGNCLKEDYKPEDASINDVIARLNSEEHLIAPPQIQFYVAAGIDGKITADYSWKNPVEVLLDPDSGALPQTNTTIVRDNFAAYILPDITRDNGVTIRRKKNLQGVTVNKDSSDIVTRIIPCGTNTDGDPLFLDGQIYVDSPHINDYSQVYAQRIDYDVKVVDQDADNETTFSSDAAARAKLKTLAEEDFSKNGIDIPAYSMEVDFIMLKDTSEYANYAGLQAVFLHDTVTVIDDLIALKSAKARVTAYKWNVITDEYDKITLGAIDQFNQMVYSYNLPNAGISGSKITPNTASGNILRDASIEYAKIAIAAIKQLNAGSISALEGRINDLTADTINTDSFAAAIAKIIALKVGKLTADSIATDQLAAALAAFQVITAGSATFDAATIRHLISAALNVENTVSGEAFIRNLRVMYAQIVAATIGDLCIRASDGNYYRIDVITDEDGTVKVEATRTTVTEDEISQGHTDAGRVILATEITAEDLSAANIYATYALVNKIDAARIDVGQLFAQQAFIDQLNTMDIRSNSFIQMMVGDATVWRVEITSSNADVLTDGSSTTLSARVYQGAIERTGEIAAACFRWRRSGDDPDADAIWNAAHAGLKTVTVSGGDVRYNAVYSCDVLDTVELLTSDGNTLLDSNNDTLTALEVY